MTIEVIRDSGFGGGADAVMAVSEYLALEKVKRGDIFKGAIKEIINEKCF